MFILKSTATKLIGKLESRINRLFKTCDSLYQDVEKFNAVVEEFNNYKSSTEQIMERLSVLEDLRQRKESNEPWVELIGGDLDPSKGLEMNLDWNDAFIDQLRRSGYNGVTESALVAKWLLNVSNSVKPEDDV